MADQNMTTVNIPKTIHTRLKALHNKTRMPIGVIVEMALDGYLKRKESRAASVDAASVRQPATEEI